MGLSFYYDLMAPATTTANELSEFLCGVEELAKSLGFSPTTLLSVPFDTPERRTFSKRLGGSFVFHDAKLKGAVPPADDQIWNYDPASGDCRLIPEYGVILVLTDERGSEACFGFFRYPGEIRDIQGRVVVDTGLQDTWRFRDFIDSPDPRYRKIVEQFVAAGYALQVKDEFSSAE